MAGAQVLNVHTGRSLRYEASFVPVSPQPGGAGRARGGSARLRAG
jgi:hypothetical protein